MRRDAWKNGLVWAGIVLAVSGAVVAGGRDGAGPPPGEAPNHAATDCGTCRAHQANRGPSLPYELGADNVRFTYPAAGAVDGG